MTIESQGPALLHALKLPQLLERFGSGEVIAATDPAVLALHTTATAHRRQLAAVLDLSPGKLPTGTLRTLLKAVGWKLQQAGRIHTRGEGGEAFVCTYTAARVALPDGMSRESLTAKWLTELQGTVTPEVKTMTHVYVIDHAHIVKCQVVKRTPKTIVILSGPKHLEWEQTYRIASMNGMVHETWEEAHAALLENAELAVQNARLELERVKGRAGQIRGMKPPLDESSP
jgi:hypothetical protein